jgi:spermidine synthase/MFS family permease
MHPRALRIAPLLFGSGFCALVYQTAWQRELRLVFGASTAASAAVLAIFMAGLGLGSALLGSRADKHKRPLELYGNLEFLIALSAAATPALLWVLRQIYVALGGTVSLGMVGGTLVRLALSALLLAVPTVLMGGTLPAAARAAETPDDVRRRALAVLYGVNTLGAVAGAACSTFFLFEVFGTQQTLWLACLLNALIALTARVVSRELPEESSAEAPVATAEPAAASGEAPPPRLFALAAAGMAGFVFFVMELVWYRMLSPLLGGSTFTFGLILALVLLGIGLGGGAYALWGKDRPATLRGFALSCMLEAFFIAVPFAMGDQLAVITMMTRDLSTFGFHGQVLGWALVAGLVMLPAAFVSGIQFPLLLALLGRGQKNVGSEVGLAYAWNTGGSILGSLAGGFGLMPLLTAPGCWRLVVIMLVAMGAVALVLSLRTERGRSGLLVPTTAGVLAGLLLTALGPTAAWRHSPIGAGRQKLPEDANERRAWQYDTRSRLVWEAEGLETSVGLVASDGLSFMVNGKSDGNALSDAGTQVMGGLVGSMLHPDPRRAFVIGLGTGSSAGWLARVPSMEKVDVVELEPAILEVARQCKGVNAGAMDNPKMNVFIGDAREVLLTSKQQYDVIFSEPSNPYRAGISSLFTREFYQAARQRLAPGGIFVQWLQSYEIDAPTLKSVYATLTSEFGAVETWQTLNNDLMLVATEAPMRHDFERLRARIAEEPYRKALAVTWETNEAEGVLAHFIGGPELARRLAQGQEHLINTDDLSYMEFGIARSTGKRGLLSMDELRKGALEAKAERPVGTGTVDWAREEVLRLDPKIAYHPPSDPKGPSRQFRERAQFRKAFAQENFAGALGAWRAAGWQPQGLFELAAVSQSLAEAGDEASLPFIEQLRAYTRTDAELLVAVLRSRQGRTTEATESMERALAMLREEPWLSRRMSKRLIKLAHEISEREPMLGRRIFTAMEQPFSTYALNSQRLIALVKLAPVIGWAEHCQRALKQLEPLPIWKGDFLTSRYLCYEATRDPKRQQAMADLEEYLAASPSPLWDMALPDVGTANPGLPPGKGEDPRGQDEGDKAPEARSPVAEEQP